MSIEFFPSGCITRRIRLVPIAPREGESLTSLLDRQAQLWHVTRLSLLRQISTAGFWGLPDPDRCEFTTLIKDISRATGIPVSTFAVAAAARNDVLVTQAVRSAYCPLCVAADLARGEAPYFRLDWARLVLTHCLQHQTPLFTWRSTNPAGMRSLPGAWLLGDGVLEDAPRWFLEDLASAQRYRDGAWPPTEQSRAAWHTQRRFELRCHAERTPHLREQDQILTSPSLVYGVLPLLAKLIGSFSPKLAWEAAGLEEGLIVDHTFAAFTAQSDPTRIVRPSWRTMVSLLKALPHRRAVLMMAAHLVN